MRESDKAYPSSARWYLEFSRKKRRAGQVPLCRCLTTATRGAAGECREREAGQRSREERSPEAMREKRGWRDEGQGRRRRLRLQRYWRGTQKGKKATKSKWGLKKFCQYRNSPEVAVCEHVCHLGSILTGAVDEFATISLRIGHISCFPCSVCWSHCEAEVIVRLSPVVSSYIF